MGGARGVLRGVLVLKHVVMDRRQEHECVIILLLYTEDKNVLGMLQRKKLVKKKIVQVNIAKLSFLYC